MARTKYKIKGTAMYPKLDRPDREEFGGKYNTKLIVPKTNAQAKALVKAMHDEAQKSLGKKASKSTFSYKDDEDGENYIFSADTNPQYPPALYDSKNNLLKERPRVGGGSVITVAGTIDSNEGPGGPYTKLRINAVMIHELHEWGASPFDDDDLGGDFEADDEEDKNTSPFSDDGDEDEDEDPPFDDDVSDVGEAKPAPRSRKRGRDF